MKFRPGKSILPLPWPSTSLCLPLPTNISTQAFFIEMLISYKLPRTLISGACPGRPVTHQVTPPRLNSPDSGFTRGARSEMARETPAHSFSIFYGGGGEGVAFCGFCSIHSFGIDSAPFSPSPLVLAPDRMECAPYS